MGLFGRSRKVFGMSREMGYLKADFPKAWLLGEEAAARYFKKMCKAHDAGMLEADYGLIRLPADKEEVTTYVTQRETPAAIEEYTRMWPEEASNQQKLRAFGISFGTTLIDYLRGERRLV